MTPDFDPHKNLETIKRLSDNQDVVPLKSISAFEGDRVEYKCKRGRCWGQALCNQGSFAVQYAEMDECTELERHTHIDNKELLIVIEGELLSRHNGHTLVARSGEVITIPAGTTHTVFCVMKTTLIGLTIPASEGYPHGRK